MKITGIELEEQDIANILTDTLETNAVGYWAVYTNWKRITNKENEDLYNCVREIKIQDEETEKCYTINAETIKLGVERIITGKISADYIRNMILDDDIDSEG